MPNSTLLESEIASDVHGAQVGGASGLVLCSYCGRQVPVKERSTVQYECAHPVAPDLFAGVATPEGWFHDAIRCGDCERSRLAFPTEGYAEALVEVGVTTRDGVHSVDACKLTVRDVSPADDGTPVGDVPQSVLEQALWTSDWGLARRGRLNALAEDLRVAERYDLADDVTAAARTGTDDDDADDDGNASD